MAMSDDGILDHLRKALYAEPAFAQLVIRERKAGKAKLVERAKQVAEGSKLCSYLEVVCRAFLPALYPEPGRPVLLRASPRIDRRIDKHDQNHNRRANCESGSDEARLTGQAGLYFWSDKSPALPVLAGSHRSSPEALPCSKDGR
jgi:hypothetical protein